MSPSESDLRAALHDGEGDGLNLDRLIIHAEAVAAQRRSRLLSGAAIVAVVLGTGLGVGLLAGTGGGNESGSNAGGAVADRAGGGQAARAPEQSTAFAPTRTGSAKASVNGTGGLSASGASCPAAPPTYLLPGGGGLDQFGANGPLFDRPVTSVIVCAYDDASRSAPAWLTGAEAEDLAASLEDASETEVASCPRAPGVGDELLIKGFSPSGRAAGTVTATPADCGSDVTNGTAVRYGWSPPKDLRSKLPTA